MTRADLCTAVAGIAKVMARSHEDHAELADAFLILTESLAEVSAPLRSRKQERIERLAAIESELHQRPLSERLQAVMREFGVSKSYVYEIRAAAIEQGLLRAQSTDSTQVDKSRTDCIADSICTR